MNIEPIQAIHSQGLVVPVQIEERMGHARLNGKNREAEPVSDKSFDSPQQDKPVNRIESAESLSDHRVNFRIDEGSGRTVIRVVDSKTHEVLQEFPRTQILEITERMKSIMGVFFDHEG